MSYRLALVVVAVGLICLNSVAEAREKYIVTVSYVVGPQRPLPEGLRAVAVINSGVSAQGIRPDEREAKWSIMAADMIEAMLQAGGSMTSPLAVAKRSETQAVLREHDMVLSGMVVGNHAAAAGKLLAVQGLITSRITICIDEQRGSKSTIDWMSVMGGMARETVGGRVDPAPVSPAPGVRRGPDGRLYTVRRHPPPLVYRQNPRSVYAPRTRGSYRQEQTVAGGGLTFQTKQVEEISRHLTVQCSFTLMDAATGQAVVQYSTPPVRKYDRKSPDFLFGGMMGEKDLDPVDHFIGELVEQSTREFVSMFVPVQMNASYELVAKHGASEDGLRAMRADDYAAAMQAFEKNIRKYPDDDAALFCMGVVSELMGKFDQALQYYRRAASAKGVDEEELVVYVAAKDRLGRHMGRILQPGAPSQPVAPTTSSLSPGGSATPPQSVLPLPAPAPVASPPMPATVALPVEPPPPTVEESTIERK